MIRLSRRPQPTLNRQEATGKLWAKRSAKGECTEHLNLLVSDRFRLRARTEKLILMLAQVESLALEKIILLNHELLPFIHQFQPELLRTLHREWHVYLIEYIFLDFRG